MCQFILFLVGLRLVTTQLTDDDPEDGSVAEDGDDDHGEENEVPQHGQGGIHGSAGRPGAGHTETKTKCGV